MRNFFCLLLLACVFQQPRLFAQTADATVLLQDAAKLNKAGQYTDAADKYAQALKLIPDDASANYGMAVALNGQGQGNEAIPYLQKVTTSGGSLVVPAYDLLGNIYDKLHNPEKAIEAYKAGINTDSANQRLYFNLGLVYFRMKNYSEAEKCAIQSIKLDPKHAASQRMYALVCFHQNKRANALLGLCSFILLQPDGPQAAEAFGNIQHILQGGTLKAEPGAPPITNDANTIALNNVITKAVADAAKEKQTGIADLLALQLTGIFKAIAPLADRQTGDDFFKNYYADYFYKLAQSPNMPAFARLISQNTPESVEWIKNNGQAMQALADWIKATAR